MAQESRRPHRDPSSTTGPSLRLPSGGRPENICHRIKWKPKAQVQILAPPHTSQEDAPRFSDSFSILAEESNTKSSSQGCEKERAS